MNKVRRKQMRKKILGVKQFTHMPNGSKIFHNARYTLVTQSCITNKCLYLRGNPRVTNSFLLGRFRYYVVEKLWLFATVSFSRRT